MADSLEKNPLDNLGRSLMEKFEITKNLRYQQKDLEFLENLRQYKGIYDPEILNNLKKNKSKVYPRYTRSKVNPCIAKLNNILFPDARTNWDIKPTKKPRLNQTQLLSIAESLISTDEQGAQIPVTKESLDMAINKFAMDTAEKMKVTIEDQLTEGGYKEKAKKVIRSGVIYGTGVLKGPLSEGIIVRDTKKNETTGELEQIEETIYKPFFDDVSIWRFYPDMSVTDFEDCSFVFEDNGMSKHELLKLARREDFFADPIIEHVRQNPKGDYKPRQWENELKTMGERSVNQASSAYEVVEFNGYLDGSEMYDAGLIPEEDAEKELFVNIWLLGGKVIKAEPLPLELVDLYHLFYFEKDESSILGEGQPRAYRDTQISICSTTRAMLDNGAMVSAPIVEINLDLIEDGEDVDNVSPGRRFLRSGIGQGAQYPAVRIYNIQSHTQEYLAILERLNAQGDMESTLPSYQFMEPTVSETPEGVAIRNANINLTMNDIVKFFDIANESFLGAIYKWNMAYNPDESIKGDMEVKAIGSSSLIGKDVMATSLDSFARTLTPEERVYIKTREFLGERVKNRDIDPDAILRTEDEAQAKIEAMRDRESDALNKEALATKTNYDAAKAESMRAKAAAVPEKLQIEKAKILLDTAKNMGMSSRGIETLTQTQPVPSAEMPMQEAEIGGM